MTSPPYRFTRSSYKGNPEKAARRAEIRAYWLANPNLLPREVGARFGVTTDTARSYRPSSMQRIAISYRTSKAEISRQVIEMHLHGAAAAEIAKGVNRSLRTVYQIIRDHKRGKHETTAT